MSRVTVADVPSWAYRGLEAVYLAPAALFMVYGLALALVPLLAGASVEQFSLVAGPLAVMYLVLLVFGLVSWLATPVLLFVDARTLSRADIDWNPTGALYAVAALFFNWLVVAHYLYKRHEYVVDRDHGDWWWLVIFGALGLVGLGALAPYAVLPSMGVNAVPLTFVALGVFLLAAATVSVALYFDSLYVRLHSEYHPNPATKFGLALFMVIFPILPLLYGTYYLVRRASNYGLSSPSSA